MRVSSAHRIPRDKWSFPSQTCFIKTAALICHRFASSNLLNFRLGLCQRGTNHPSVRYIYIYLSTIPTFYLLFILSKTSQLYVDSLEKISLYQSVKNHRINYTKLSNRFFTSTKGKTWKVYLLPKMEENRHGKFLAN